MTADEKTRFLAHVLELIKYEQDMVKRVELATLAQRALGLVSFHEINEDLRRINTEYALT